MMMTARLPVAAGPAQPPMGAGNGQVKVGLILPLSEIRRVMAEGLRPRAEVKE